MTIVTDNSHLACEHSHLACDHGHLTCDHGHLASDHGHLTCDHWSHGLHSIIWLATHSHLASYPWVHFQQGGSRPSARDQSIDVCNNKRCAECDVMVPPVSEGDKRVIVYYGGFARRSVISPQWPPR